MNTQDKIRRMRTARGWTRRQLAEASGIREQNLYAYETGRRCPKIENFQKICAALGFKAEIIITALPFDNSTAAT